MLSCEPSKDPFLVILKFSKIPFSSIKLAALTSHILSDQSQRGIWAVPSDMLLKGNLCSLCSHACTNNIRVCVCNQLNIFKVATDEQEHSGCSSPLVQTCLEKFS